MKVEIKPVESPSDLRAFVKMPFTLYKDHPYWVPPLITEEINTLDATKNPILKKAELGCFLALKSDQIVGRIAVISHPADDSEDGPPLGRFGWFDAIDDPDVISALVESGADWLKERGYQGMKGPMGFTNLDKAGMLVEGFDEISTAASLYNYPYYPERLETLGFEKLVDYVEFEATVPESIPDRIHSFAQIVQQRYNLQMPENLSRAEIARYGRELFSLLNQTHAHLSGFVRISDEQIEQYVKMYLPLVKKDYLCIVTNESDELLGFGIAMPSFSRALQRSGGKLWPFGFIHFWMAQRRSRRADLMLIGVRPDMQNKGIPALIFYKIMKAFIDNGVKKVETNPELESNERIQKLWREYEMRQHKRRRIYVKYFD